MNHHDEFDYTTTFLRSSGTTFAGLAEEIPGSTEEIGTTATGHKTAATTSHAASGTTTGTPGAPSSTTAAPGSPNSGATLKASETTTAPGVTTTVSTSVAARATTGPHIDQSVCHGPLGEEKFPGDTWTSNCHECTCTNANAVECTPRECPSPPKCSADQKLITLTSNDTCCEIGHCEPRTCLFNNTDYKIGASIHDPSNPCLSYSCNSSGLVAVVQDCPKQTWCAERDRVYDSKNCCYTCKNDCRTSPINVTIKYNGCRKKIEMARCLGECKRTVRYNYDHFQLENSCLCCREESYEFRDAELDCSDGSTAPYRYRHTTACSCLDQCEQSTAS
uniref:apomucin-like n=1 Tax=Jaculus jaculus TaxID=51337 RepID=UPI001E1B42D4|nr:apomucin-like [Jaculus jaculus]